jgi:CBS domain-containing protein
MGLPENIKNEQVSRLDLREPITVSPDDTVRDVIVKMRKKNLGCVIAVDEQQKPVGLFTESMLTQLVAQDTALLELPLKEHLTERWPWVRMTDPISYVLEAMYEKNVRFLCVVDKDGRLKGLTGQKGLMEFVAEHFTGQVMVQRIGGTPYTQNREGA